MAPPRSSFHPYLLFSCFLLAATTPRILVDAAGAPQLQKLDCSTEGNYTAGDAYAANLNQLLAALPSTTVSENGGFFNGTVGVAAVVYGLALCSADFSRQDCTDCLTAASSNGTGLPKRCPGSVTASIMFDQCMIRYSNRSFFGNNETGIVYSVTSGQQSATKSQFSDNLKQGLAYLSAQAAMSPERFAASSTTPFALVQCTWDLPSDKCKACIDTLSANASNLFQVGIEGQRKSYSCFVRYSNASFTVVPLVTPAPAGNNNITGSVDTRISSTAIVAGAVTGSVVVVGSIIAVIFCLIRKRQLPYRRLKNERKEGGVMSLEFLNEITSNFSDENILGSGAFGKVYKGVLYGKEIAAVKRLFSSFDTEALKRELSNLSGLNHQNIVQLLGYCYETKRELVDHEEEQEFVSDICIAMIFEYMHKGTLETYLKESEARNWKADYKIIKGTCEGLRYLHKGLESPMLHLDLKPSNILLSNNMVPKLADFGLSTKLVSDSQTQATRPFGTRGYMPPEYVPGKDVSKEFDIFSLGVVMLDIIAGPEGYKKKEKMTSFQEFTDYVQKNWRKRLEARRATINKYEYQVKRCLEIAMDCVNADPTQRPSIDDIISKLQDTENNTKKKTSIENTATTLNRA